MSDVEVLVMDGESTSHCRDRPDPGVQELLLILLLSGFPISSWWPLVTQLLPGLFPPLLEHPEAWESGNVEGSCGGLGCSLEAGCDTQILHFGVWNRRTAPG